MAPLIAMERTLELEWGRVTHLAVVRNTPALRDAVSEAIPYTVQLSLRVQQSKKLYEV